eukprot:CAMPEP_0177301806 /NCGR_PEP_ID=MMETSP0368-20130122/5254_1 /TAXON_ID=447022 ORGANISM="Scrippsiella hangoei-like, Strain SHHI-4" /NCGR_SAMPLE_ID=MMETSP0368 /ASSEMBLY_ACC=CAM_ASM_000363 /LENGTH=167 /DNA_ID=CAMNT_0018760227 /DNA_START=174 /DNA_END=677 /DNA_ORIENTATION=-
MHNHRGLPRSDSSKGLHRSATTGGNQRWGCTVRMPAHDLSPSCTLLERCHGGRSETFQPARPLHLLGLLSPPQARRLDARRRRGKVREPAAVVDRRTHRGRHLLVHEWGIPVSLDQGLQALQRLAPIHSRLRGSRHGPPREAREASPEALSLRWADEVHEGVEEARA